MQDGFIDDTVRQVEVIHKIVEVKIHEDKTK
jgi:tetrahydromethanopterin S-methyltransferase subunit A